MLDILLVAKMFPHNKEPMLLRYKGQPFPTLLHVEIDNNPTSDLPILQSLTRFIKLGQSNNGRLQP